ncbi:MAG: hypothetical protein DSZ23_06285, partial [Thermodesulfatator sp.]
MSHTKSADVFEFMIDSSPENNRERSSCSVKLAITGGGTGGHVFPGIAIAEEIEKKCSLECLWIGTGRAVEKNALKEKNWLYRVLKVRPLKGKGAMDIIAALVHLPVSVVRACLMLRKFRPDIVLGV